MPKPCVFFDLDGTWYRWQLYIVWVEGMIAAGLLPHSTIADVEDKFRAYKNREGSFDDYTYALIESYHGNERMKGIRVEDARRVAQEIVEKRGREIHVFPRELARAARQAGYGVAVISGSPTEVVEAFARENGVESVLGTEHPIADGRYLGGRAKEWCRDKKAAIRKLAEEKGYALDQSVAIGDSPTDQGMLEEVRYPIGFNPTQALLDTCRSNRWPIVIERKDVQYFERFEQTKEGITRTEARLDDLLPPDIVAAWNAAD